MKKYLDISKHAFDKFGIMEFEAKALVDTGSWKKVVVTDDFEEEVTVQFRDENGKFYSESGLLPPGTEVMVNEISELAVVVACRNNIESDWRTLMRLS